ncbi:MAG: signal peptidase I [Fimbriimonadaceae bacterium]|nr:signal peptidase I [Fimbriimonadaceae bacterium]
MALPRAKSSKKKKIAVRGFTAFLFCVLAFVFFFSMNFSTVEVRGPSMEPTFNTGDHVLVSKAYWLVGDIKQNDIVVVRSREVGGEYYIKRVYKTGGETVDFFNMPANWSITNGEFVVPDRQYYVLGDNRPVSEDSRTWGPVELKEVIGKVIVIKFGFMEAKAAVKE